MTGLSFVPFPTRPNLSDLSDSVNPKPPLNGNELITTAGPTPKGQSMSSDPISALISRRNQYQTLLASSTSYSSSEGDVIIVGF